MCDNILIAIDPGKYKSGWAVFANGELSLCGKGEPFNILKSQEYTRECTGEIIVERPQVYDVKRSKGDPNDLICISITAGQWIGLNSDLRPYSYVYKKKASRVGVLPKDWKGQLGKLACRARARLVLGVNELQTAGNEQPDKWDAIAIGLWRLGRLKMR